MRCWTARGASASWRQALGSDGMRVKNPLPWVLSCLALVWRPWLCAVPRPSQTKPAI